ncbi:MAG: FAD-binding oxidoreductase [Spirochaetales bacterium]|nr:FAD-binding oxidoreductase [Spirochaetales bacterium]
MAERKKYHGFKPEWETVPPQPGSYRSILKWGNPQEFKEPNERLYALMKKTFGLDDQHFHHKGPEGNEPVPPQSDSQLDPRYAAQFKQILGKDHVSEALYDRLSVAYGKTMYDLYRLREHIIENIPDAVLYPGEQAEIEAIVAYCHQENIPLQVYGGGSSVTRGMEAMKGGITLDMRPRFNKVVAFNEINQTITVQAGMSGPKLENLLNEAPSNFGASRAYTCGHFPQSFEYSSVGGWVVTRGAGQNSTYYGNIKDMVMGQDYATPQGSLSSYGLPAHAVGPEIDEIMMGSEGAFGVLTHVTLKVHRLTAKNRQRFSFIFRNWDEAQKAAREIMQNEAGYPSVFRLSDPEETDVMLKLYKVEGTILESAMNALGYKPMERCLLLAWSEGERGFAKNLAHQAKRICRKHRGMSLTGYPVKSWEHGRFTDPYLRESLQDYDIIIDTMECGVTWDRMGEVHQQVRSFAKSRPNTICMTHLSHAYPQGANLYFIFIGKFKDKEEYLEYQYGILDNIQKSGASMSHHHGVGKMTAPWVEGSIGSQRMELFRTLKKHFDPKNVMNPGGTLGLDLSPEEQRFPKYAGRRWDSPLAPLQTHLHPEKEGVGGLDS